VIDPLTRLPDGTIKQVNPFTGTKVWTLPGRGARPLGTTARTPLPIDPADHDQHCAFCLGRMLETPPEIARLVRDPNAAGGWREIRGLLAEQLEDCVAEFRLIPNLFEILSYDYWRLTHGFVPTPEQDAHRSAYLSTPLGREHVESLVRNRLRAAGVPHEHSAGRPFEEHLAESVAFFASNHQVVVARRHFLDGATDDSQICSSGRLSPEEHLRYTELAVSAMSDLYRGNPHTKYVSVFQNWLRPAGASFDHLHKQVVAIDELGTHLESEVTRLRAEPDLYTRWGRDYAEREGLVVARTEHAVAFAGVGHQYPALEVHVVDHGRCPWDLSAEEISDFSDLLHACHAATGSDIPTNEEWHHRPPSVDLPMPLRAVLKWRVSTMAGFEGGTKIYVNTIDPLAVRDRVIRQLEELSAAGRLSPRVQVAQSL
jgi:galactose-1-phosphate uridylyltransferase